MKQRSFILATILLLFVSGWSFGFFYQMETGIHDESHMQSASKPTAAPVVAPKELFPDETTDSPLPTPEIPSYRVQAQGNHIYILELHSDDTVLQVEDAEIELNSLREEDRKLLQDGLDVENRTEAEAILENFME